MGQSSVSPIWNGRLLGRVSRVRKLNRHESGYSFIHSPTTPEIGLQLAFDVYDIGDLKKKKKTRHYDALSSLIRALEKGIDTRAVNAESRVLAFRLYAGTVVWPTCLSKNLAVLWF